MSPAKHAVFRLALFCLFVVVCAQVQAAENDTPPVTREEKIVAHLIAQINDFRRQRGLAAFAASKVLIVAAAEQSRDMVKYNFFDHQSPVPGRRMPWDRAVAAGYPSTTIAENLFYCQGTPDDDITSQCFQTWATSSGHLANMLDTTRSEIGVGVASNDQGETYITAVFGRP